MPQTMMMDEESFLLKKQDVENPKDIRKKRRDISVAMLLGVLLGISFMHVIGKTSTSSSGQPNIGGSWQISSDVDKEQLLTMGTNSKYTQFQGLSFQIYTGGAPAVDGNGDINAECVRMNSYGRSDGEIQCYVGMDDSALDVKKRLEIMTTAVERAYALSSHDKSTLKVFLAPEFFWRGKDGAYVYNADNDMDEEEDCTDICQILKGLEELVAQERFEDWLFLFGTVTVSEALPKEDEWDYLFYNFAPVYKGYNPAKSGSKGKRFLVPKRYVSNLDFLTPERHFNDTMAKEIIQRDGQQQQASNTTVLNPYDLHKKKYDREMWHRYKDELNELGYIMIEYDWFIMDGITFTIEVCLDHDMRTALSTYLAYAVMESPLLIPSVSDGRIDYVPIPKYQAQISLVASSGMTINPASLALTNNGSILLQDGMSNEDVIMSWSDECFQYSWHFDGGSEVIQRNALISPTEVVFEYSVNDRYLKHYIYDDDGWRKALEGVFSNAVYEPKMTVYEPTDIAKVPVV